MYYLKKQHLYLIYLRPFNQLEALKWNPMKFWIKKKNGFKQIFFEFEI